MVSLLFEILEFAIISKPLSSEMENTGYFFSGTTGLLYYFISGLFSYLSS